MASSHDAHPEGAPFDSLVSSPVIAAAVRVVDSDIDSLPEWIARVRLHGQSRLDIIVVDATRAGDVALEGVTRVREPSPSRGLAWAAVLEATTADWIAWCSPDALYAPNRLERQLEEVRYEDEIDLVTCDFNVERAADGYSYRVSPEFGSVPPGGWEDGVLIHRDALANIHRAAFRPIEFELYQELSSSGRVAHVSDALYTISEERFEQLSKRARVDAELVRIAEQEPRPEPELSVLIHAREPGNAWLDCVEAYARQCMRPGTLEIVVAAEAEVDASRAPTEDIGIGVAFKFVRNEGKGPACANATLAAQASGRLLLFVNVDALPCEDTVRAHLAAHRDLAENRGLVVGAIDAPPHLVETAIARLVESSTLVFDHPGFRTGAPIPASTLSTRHFSLPREALAEVGGFDRALELGASDADLGLRLERAGWKLHYRPECRIVTRTVPGLDEVRSRQREAGRAFTSFFEKHPALLSGEPWAGLERDQLRSQRETIQPFLPVIDRAARTLAGVNLARIEQLSELEGTADQLADRLAHLFARINAVWWNDGFLDGFEESNLFGFTDVFAGWKQELPPVGGHAVILRPAKNCALPWATKVEAWFAQRGNRAGEGKDGHFLLLLAGEPDGLDVAQIQRRVAPILRRAQRAGFSTPIAIGEVNDSELRERLFRSAGGWIPAGTEFDRADARLARQTSCPTIELAIHTRNADPYWPLSTEAPTRVFAWPKWDDPESLGCLVDCLIAFAGREDVCIVLRHDGDHDADIQPGLAALDAALTPAADCASSTEKPLEVMIESAPMAETDWLRLSKSIDAALRLPNTPPEREELIRLLGRPRLGDGRDVEHWLAARDASPLSQIQSLSELEVRLA